jgi:2-polyprenyl-6-methoxyphenol hydroxylase-like FAD-dependent oxidoreductase
MNIRKQVDERTTKEVGIRLVDGKGKVWGELPLEGDDSLTSEVEIVRGELAKLFYQISKSNVEYIFGTTISDFVDGDNGVNVTLKTLANGEHGQRIFDVIIAAEGLYSSTRAKAFKEDISAPIRSMDLFSASFSLPADATDTQWGDAVIWFGRRGILARPDGFGRVRATMMWYDKGSESRAIGHPRTPVDIQKEYIRSRFQDIQSSFLSRFLDGLARSDDLYLAEIGQTKTPSWSKGRIVLLADTAYCPSALSGMGTTTAIVGAYILAAELVRNPVDHAGAFAAYESQLRPWIEKIQNVPDHNYASSKWAVALLYRVAYVLSTAKKFGLLYPFGLISRLFSKIFPSKEQKLPLPSPSIFDRQNA